MARAGRKRKTGARQPNGQRQRLCSEPEEYGVYFVEYPARHAIKVGISKRRNGRVRALSTSCPDDLLLLDWVRCKSREQAYELEQTLHRQLKKCGRHYRGEWFCLSAPDAKHLAENARRYVESLELVAA